MKRGKEETGTDVIVRERAGKKRKNEEKEKENERHKKERKLRRDVFSKEEKRVRRNLHIDTSKSPSLPRSSPSLSTLRTASIYEP